MCDIYKIVYCNLLFYFVDIVQMITFTFALTSNDYNFTLKIRSKHTILVLVSNFCSHSCPVAD